MKEKPKARPFLTCMGIVLLLLLAPVATIGAERDSDSQAPGRTMAQQATKGQREWNTTDHSKLKALQKEFTSGADVTAACVSCHSEAASQFHKTIHWQWLADPGESKGHGKAGYSLNNFCISTNKTADRGCMSCHPGWGNSLETEVNCLVCHSRKEMNFDEAVVDIAAFLKEGDEESLEIVREIQAELRAAAQSVALPHRKNCGSCHFKGGGGDGVKHGDLDTSLSKPNKALDVHMGVDGQNFDCTRCHSTKLHNIAGRIYTRPASTHRKSLIEDDLTPKITCESCHSATPHKAGHKANDHTDKVACQSCHIPRFARVNPTKMSWDWSQAGRLKNGKPYKTEDSYGKHDYMSIKGEMKWAKNVRPEYFWFNGIISSVTTADMIDPGRTVRVSWPEGSRDDPQSRIYPFKVHRGRQPYDKVNKTLLAPLLSGPNGYWKTLDWDDALSRGQKSLDMPYSHQFDFVDTTYVFPTTHMVAPKDDAVSCGECHTRKEGRMATLGGFYMPGRDLSDWVDSLGWIAVLGALVGVGLHGLGRFFSNGRNGRKEDR